MFENPAMPVGVAAASLPPVTTASQRPHMIWRAAAPMAWVAAAQAVTMVSQGP